MKLLTFVVPLFVVSGCQQSQGSERGDAHSVTQERTLDLCEGIVIRALDFGPCLLRLSRTCDAPLDGFEVVFRSDVRMRLGGAEGDCSARSKTVPNGLTLLVETEGQPSVEFVKISAGVTTSPIPSGPIPTVMCGFCLGGLQRGDAGWTGSFELGPASKMVP